ncbi:hypothetical protein PgNI_06253 [Pyricularia grisea]|uniref:Uncharacterized protein n=1 Tax=Pyricularia grisea TaxID=148305 RepID=A0A6P8B7Z2_PYRGI|nr:hypothetical protein PgNI_06253 [Pyricularia grisea]TLD11234.1 hypothetical protein PgNI_06253 [Pyricularia grisea]
MCFQEFIGYTCGHCSMPVLRPCSLTTSVHQNPVCSLQATRPFISPEMCPACSRIMHTRAVLIQEWEHHFLHERGACGCDVIFPDLVRPRVIGGEAVFRYQAMMEQQNNAVMDKAQSKNNNAHAVVSYNLPPTPPPQDGQTAPPIFQEVHGPDGQLAIAVRLPSLYAAEWVDDHRKLHQRGECSCKADFTPYKPEWAVQDGRVQDQQQQQQTQPQVEYATPIAPASMSPERRRAVSVDISQTLIATCNDTDNTANKDTIEVRTEVNYPKHRRSSSAEVTTTSNSSTHESSDVGVEVTTSDFAHYIGEEDNQQHHDMATVNPPSMIQTHNWGPALRAISADGDIFKPRSSATAVNQTQHNEQHDMEMHMAKMHMGAGMQPQQQSVCSFTNLTGGNSEEHQRFRNPTALPIASLPVGAGPEGRHRHTVPFEQCVLRRYPPGVRTRYYN